MRSVRSRFEGREAAVEEGRRLVGKRLNTCDPCSRKGGPKDHATVNFKCARIEIGIRHSIAPRLKELTRNVGNVPAGTKVLDAKAWVRRAEGLLPRHLKLNHPSL